MLIELIKIEKNSPTYLEEKKLNFAKLTEISSIFQKIKNISKEKFQSVISQSILDLILNVQGFDQQKNFSLIISKIIFDDENDENISLDDRFDHFPFLELPFLPFRFDFLIFNNFFYLLNFYFNYFYLIKFFYLYFS